MATILLLSGPNLNLLGEREPRALRDHDARRARRPRPRDRREGRSRARAPAVEPRGRARRRDPRRARPMRARSSCNAGAFTHYAYALADALATFDGVKIELHLSNPDAREPWRHVSVLTPVVDGVIAGLRGTGYRLAIEARRSPLGGTMMTDLTTPRTDGRRGRLPRLRTALARERSARAARHEARQRALPHRVHRLGGLALRERRRRTLRHRRSVPHAVAGADRRRRPSTRAIEIGLTMANQREILAEVVGAHSRLGLEEHSVTWAEQRDYVERVRGRRGRPRRARRSRTCDG